MANTKSIGVAFLDQDIIGADTITSNGVLGFTAAGNAAVTQLTSKSTGVTLNKPAGQITMNNASLATSTAASFTLTNSYIGAKDTVLLAFASGATVAGYNYWISSVSAGSCVVTIRNISGGSLSEAIVINFAVIKSA